MSQLLVIRNTIFDHCIDRGHLKKAHPFKGEVPEVCEDCISLSRKLIEVLFNEESNTDSTDSN